MENQIKYSLGLDIGIASVGYGVINLDENKIEIMGVRGFDKAEVPKTGESPALSRRLCRGQRRTIRRRAGRMKAIKNFLVNKYNLVSEKEFNTIFQEYKENLNPWFLRKKGLDEKLTNEELVKVLYHLGKHRGFKSNRKNIEIDSKSDDGKAKSAIKENLKLLEEKKYRTLGEMFALDDKFKYRKRNSTDNYVNTLDREMLVSEAKIILENQKEYNNLITDEFIEEFIKIFTYQKPFATGEQIKKLVGYCSIFKDEIRAPKMSYTSERFMLLQRVNNLKYIKSGDYYRLNDTEREILVKAAYEKSKVTYTQIKKLLNLDEDVRFSGITYSNKKNDPTECEKATFVELKGNNILKKAFGNNIVLLNSQQKDYIVEALTFYKDDEDIRNFLKEKIDDKFIDIVLKIPEFSKTANLSFKAMRMLLKYLEAGFYYSEALEKCELKDETKEKQYKLPVIDTSDLTNPVMVRAISQVRKVVNAIIDKYGSPYEIHIELAREMGKSYKQRKEIEKVINQNTIENTNLRNEISKTLEGNIRRDMMEKVKLYHEQDGKCAYSFEEINYELMLKDDNYCQVDHILPYSRSFDNTMSNKVLVLAGENQMKTNKTPYEYFGQDQERWNKFVSIIYSNLKIRVSKRNKLLNKTFGKNEEEFLKRNLTDTQYINRYLSNYFKKYLQFYKEVASEDLFGNTKNRKTVKCVNGQAVSRVRSLWGLYKNRDENDTHHSLDAIVIAGMSDGILNNVTRWYQTNKEEYIVKYDKETGEIIKDKVPMPWETFNIDVNNYINSFYEDVRENEDKVKVSTLAPEDNQKSGRIFISRMPVRKAKGALHKETIRAERYNKGVKVKVSKKNLTELTKADLDNIYNESSDILLYNAIKKRMEKFGYNGKEAFKEPFYKPKSDGTPGNIVTKIKLCEVYNSGIPIRKGVADNDSIVRSDIFTKDGKYYIVPVYTWHIAKGELPNKAILANKEEKEWIKMTEEYKFLFSLYPYDLVHIVTGKQNIIGYYRSVHRRTGSLTLTYINNNSEEYTSGIGTAKLVNKYNVDILGNYHLIRGEKRELINKEGK